MKTTIDGVSITLTDAQVKYIRTVKFNRRKGLKCFESVLLRFGFIRHQHAETSDYDRCYKNDYRGWWAELYDGNRVWVIGEGLRDSTSYPGGHMYHTPDELITELEKQL